MTYRKSSLAAYAFVACLLATSFAWAQATGDIRIQGESVEKERALISIIDEGPLLDFREEMRLFVQSISRYARQTKPNFIVIAKDGLELLVKRDLADDTITSPARTYMHALDGIMQEGMFYAEAQGDRAFGTPPVKEKQIKILELADHAKRNGLKVLLLDFGKGKKIIDDARRQANARGFISLVSDVASADIHKLPTYPRRPYKENPNSVISLDMVQNYVTIRNSAPHGQQSQFALKMHDTNYDAVLVEVFHGRKPLTRQAVETLKFKKLGARRLVFAYMNVGSAASYHYYWKPDWQEGSPPWIGAPVKKDQDRYDVQFWDAGWQSIISGNTNSYIYGIIAQGFDGVIIDGTDRYKNFEGEIEDQ